MHTATLAHMHTCRCSSSSWSFITRSAPVVKPSSSVSHICRLAWQPEGPHASRGETFAPLFVSQNNIRSPIVFSSPPQTPSTHCLSNSIRGKVESKTFGSMIFDTLEICIDSCETPPGHIMFHIKLLVSENH